MTAVYSVVLWAVLTVDRRVKSMEDAMDWSSADCWVEYWVEQTELRSDDYSVAK